MPDLSRLFAPERIVLVGASEAVLFSAGIARYLLNHGFGDRLALVNPRSREVFGKPTFPDVATASATAGPFDLAIVAIAAPGVPGVIRELGAAGCPLAIVESAGFAETGAQGEGRQRELAAAARESGVRVLGPNCVGVVNTRNGFASTEVQRESLAPGGVALVAQSGVFGSILLDAAPSVGLRFSKAITLGNRVDLDESDFLDYLADDPDTRVVAMYLEGVADGPRFMAAMRRCTARKPVLVLKGGHTEAGARAVGSHTASLAGSDAVFSGALRQTGAIRVASLDELTDGARAFDLCPALRGPRVAMVTTSGSQGILATDIIVRHGLELATLSDATLARMRALTPPWVPLGNPLDLGPSGVYAAGIEALLADPNVDALMVLLAVPWGAILPAVEAGMPMSGLLGEAEMLRAAAREKPILIAHMGYPRFREMSFAAVGDFLPIYPNSERAARALGLLAQRRERAAT